jgi:melibiose permease/lactose/raffinose/galactose permease
MKERKVDEETAKKDADMKLKDIFTVIGKNDQLRWSIIAIILYYTGSGVLVAGGLNYFYFSFGYAEGGNYQFIFTVVFAVATFLGQFLYPVLKNKIKWSNMKIFTISSLTTIISYVGLFAFVFFPDYVKFFPVMCFFAFTAFIGQTIISLILYIMIQDTIDYNEYKFGERRESATFALRAFSAKIAGSIQQGVLYLFLVGSSLLVVSNQIANWEREFAGLKDVILQHASTITGAENIELWQRVVFQVGFTVVPMVLFLLTFIIIKAKYKITEESHRKMLEEIEARKNIVSE